MCKVQVAVRVPTALLDDLDRIAAQMTEDAKVEISRASVIRAALAKFVRETLPRRMGVDERNTKGFGPD